MGISPVSYTHLVRYDGSSRFHSDYRWGIFPSFSAGWVMSEEAFMKNADIKWLSFLKLRASYGTLGNERISDNYYPYQAFINFSNVLFYKNGTVAVSYTHLDVYKRQEQEQFDFGFATGRIECCNLFLQRGTFDIIMYFTSAIDGLGYFYIIIM